MIQKTFIPCQYYLLIMHLSILKCLGSIHCFQNAKFDRLKQHKRLSVSTTYFKKAIRLSLYASIKFAYRTAVQNDLATMKRTVTDHVDKHRMQCHNCSRNLNGTIFTYETPFTHKNELRVWARRHNSGRSLVANLGNARR